VAGAKGSVAGHSTVVRAAARSLWPAVATEDDNARVVIFHRQSPVVLGPLYLANVFASLRSARWDVARPRERRRPKFLGVTRVDEHRRTVHVVDVSHRLELDLGRAPECAPHRDAELKALDIREARGQEFLAQPLAAAAKGTATVENDGRRPVVAERPRDLPGIGNILRHRTTGLPAHVHGAGNVAHCVLSRWTGVEDSGAAIGEDAAKVGSAYL